MRLSSERIETIKANLRRLVRANRSPCEFDLKQFIEHAEWLDQANRAVYDTLAETLIRMQIAEARVKQLENTKDQDQS